MKIIKTSDQLLDEAILAGNLLDTQRAVGLGADIIRIDRRTKVPLFMALGNIEILDFIVKAIVEKSQVFDKGLLNKEETRKALYRNLLDRVDIENHPFLYRVAIRTDADRLARYRAGAGTHVERLATVWNNLKGIISINGLYDDDKPLVHDAATLPDVLAYLLREGAQVNTSDKHGETPVMKTVKWSHVISAADVDKLLAIYERYNVDVHAVDNKGRGLAYHALSKYGLHNTSDINTIDNKGKCIDWLLKKGVDFFAKDKEGKIPTDYFLNTEHSEYDADASHYFNHDMVCTKLAAYGHNLSALLHQYSDERSFNMLFKSFKERKSEICGQLAQPDLAARLWNPDGSPSTLLLSAFGYGVPEEIFKNPCFSKDLAAAHALHKKIEKKLPLQCQEMLRTGIDLSFLRDADSPPRSAAVTKALRRKSPAPGDKSSNSPEGGRQ